MNMTDMVKQQIRALKRSTGKRSDAKLIEAIAQSEVDWQTSNTAKRLYAAGFLRGVAEERNVTLTQLLEEP